MLQDIDQNRLEEMSFEELMEIVERENIDIGKSSSKSGLITKINMALREAGIEAKPVEKPTKAEPKENDNDLNSVPRKMLKMCKEARKKKIFCPEIYAPIFGAKYTFLLNCVPVTVRFDGTEQEFPDFIADRILEKMNEVARSNAVKEEAYEELA